MTLTAPRIAISQPPMAWSVEENLATIARQLDMAQRIDDKAVLFPELMVTGFHTDVPAQLERARIESAWAEIAQWCRKLALGAFVGTPLWQTDRASKPATGLVMFDRRGRTAGFVEKARLMPPGEPMIFRPGARRDTVPVDDMRVCAVICREIADHAELAQEIRGEPDVIVWPASMARPERDPDDPKDAVNLAMLLARDHGTWIFHANWAWNVQRRDIPNTGKSLVISPTGEMLFEAPENAPGLIGIWKRTPWIPDRDVTNG